MLEYKKILTALLFIFSFVNVSAQSAAENESQSIIYTPKQQQLRISVSDIRLVADKVNGGYHLYVKKLPNVNSILLTETTKDPTGKNDSYAYRAREYNSINGDEIRILDGKPLVSEGAKYSLVDSTVEKTDFMGEAFHVYIPEKIVFGYEWSRHGEIEISKGTFINIRSFEKPYADYTGDYVDNPFMFDFVKRKRVVKKSGQNKAVPKETEPKKIEKKPEPKAEPVAAVKELEEISDIIEEPVEDFADVPKMDEPEEETVLTDDYNPLAYDKFKDVAEDLFCSKGPEDLIETIRDILYEDRNSDVDVVFAIDTTGSMKNDMDKLKKELPAMLTELFSAAESNKTTARVGLLLYRDYGDAYNYMELPVKPYGFTENYNTIGKTLNSVRIYGKEGGDIPEAVYEALYASAEFFKWRDNVTKRVILIGDAEPHPVPRKSGKYSKEVAMAALAKKGATVKAILLPKD